jgi:hypothetical protein
MERKVNRRLFFQMNVDAMPSFYSTDDFPEVKLFAERFADIKSEYLANGKKDEMYMPYPARKLYLDDDWKVIPFEHKGTKFQDHPDEEQFIDGEREFPILSKTIEEVFGDRVQTSGFSMLKANSHIGEHRGMPDNCLRFHLGIDVPEGDIGIRVGDDVQRWEDGSMFIFDDRKLHEAWNNTNQDRVVFIIDFVYDGEGFFQERKFHSKN